MRSTTSSTCSSTCVQLAEENVLQRLAGSEGKDWGPGRPCLGALGDIMEGLSLSLFVLKCLLPSH